MSAHPSQIFICVAGKELPDWVVERMTTAEIAADGSFEIDAGDGPTIVKPGFAVFEVGGEVYACLPKSVPEKLKALTEPGNVVVEKLVARSESERERSEQSRQVPAAKVNGDKPLKLKPMIGSPPTPAFCLVDSLLVDDTYQRSIEGGASQKLIVKIAESWDWRLCLPLLVSRRGGKMYVIDGQHRLEAARLRGDIRDMPVVVFDFDDTKAEAELFVAANRSRRAMSPLDDFHAAVVAGDAKAVAINDVVTEAGLTVGRNPAWQYLKAGEVVFVSAVQKALNAQGKPVVGQALTMMGRAFDGLVLIGGGALFTGLCMFIAKRMKAGEPLDLPLMEMVLANVGIPGWKEATEGAESGQDRVDAMLRALSDAYTEAEAQ